MQIVLLQSLHNQVCLLITFKIREGKKLILGFWINS